MKLVAVAVGASVTSVSLVVGCAASSSVGSSVEAGMEAAASSSSGGGSTDGGGGGDVTVAAEDGGPDSTVAADAGTEAASSALDAGATDAPADVVPDVYGGSTSRCPSFDGGSGGTAPSCAPGGPGMTNCGGGDAGSESCCTSLGVPCGTYYRTYNTLDSLTGPPDGGWPDEADPATISGFRLDKYDVTVGRFRQFVNAVLPPDGGTGWLPTPGSGKHVHLNGGLGLINSAAQNEDGGGAYETGWAATDDSDVAPTNTNLACGDYSTWTNTAGTQENLPINCVTREEAYAFCIWDGGFLPSEAEWEYAAVGGSEQRVWPWGSAQLGSACPGTGCDYAIYDCYYPTGAGTCTGTVAFIAPVGTATLGAGLWGQLDMAGDMDQRPLDWSAPYVDPCNDCAYLRDTTQEIVRGGNYSRNSTANWLPTVRPYVLDGERTDQVGFRCARTP